MFRNKGSIIVFVMKAANVCEKFSSGSGLNNKNTKNVMTFLTVTAIRYPFINAPGYRIDAQYPKKADKI